MKTGYETNEAWGETAEDTATAARQGAAGVDGSLHVQRRLFALHELHVNWHVTCKVYRLFTKGDYTVKVIC